MFRRNTKIKRIVLTVSFAALVFLISSLRLLKPNTNIRWRAHLTLDNHLKLRRNSSTGKTKLLLFVGILSAPSRLERRNAIRETWMTECRRTSNVVCRFFTDGQNPEGQGLEDNIRIALENEAAVYNDTLLTEVPGGLNFAIKYLWMLQWASERYDFQYYLRLDDDYFICLHKLLLELESHRPKEKLQWGWLHCDRAGATWLDESFYLISKDIVESFLSRKDFLMCNLWESQSIGYWLKIISSLTTFTDNKRLLHHQSDSENEIQEKKEVCHSLLGIHESHPEKMRSFWSIYKKEKKNDAYHVPPISYDCKYQIEMDYTVWNGDKFWFSEPKPCKDNPIWGRVGEYKGRNFHE